MTSKKLIIHLGVKDNPLRNRRQGLTQADLLTIRYMSEGQFQSHIAREMKVSGSTVWSRVHRLKQKLGVKSANQIVRTAKQKGIL
jgi:DNA-binding NarL/FixJ family response regulator